MGISVARSFPHPLPSSVLAVRSPSVVVLAIDVLERLIIVLRGVVVHDVDDHGDSGAVEGLDHVTEFVDSVAGAAVFHSALRQ
jgi:hypothetical protein